MIPGKKGIRSLRMIFLSSIAGLFLVLTGVSLLVFRSSYQDITDNYIELFAQSQSLLQKHRILTIMEREAVLSQRMAKDTVVKLWARDEKNPVVQAQAREQLEGYRQFFRDKTFFLGFTDSRNYYLTETGQPELLFRNLDPDNPADRWFFDTLRSQKDFWINVDYSVVINRVKVWFNTLIREGDGRGRILGITGTGMDVTLFLEEVVVNSPLGINPIILNTSGDILAHRDKNIVMHNSTVTRDEDRIRFWSFVNETDRKKVENSFQSLINTATEDKVFTFDLELEGKPVTLAASYIPQLNWYSLVIVDPATVLAISRFLPLITTILVTLVIISVLVFLLISRIVLRPLALLTKAAHLVAEGDYTQPPVYESKDEFGVLTKSFSKMTIEIHKYTTQLEELVKIRTNELEESQKGLMDSLRYSQLIQRSIMPPKDELQQEMSESYIVYRPLKEVGGDYAFFRPLSMGFCLAVVDCTGHGVPGALMTMMVHANLNRVLDTHTQADPGQLLLALHELVQHSLRASAELAHVENGLDIGLCVFDRAKRELLFCGGGISLLRRGEGSFEWFEHSQGGLGFRTRKKSMELKVHRIPVTEQSIFYLFTDGLLDLPRGAQGFGMGKNGVESLVLSCSSVTLEEEGRKITQTLDTTEAEFPPKDDLLLLGFKPRL